MANEPEQVDLLRGNGSLIFSVTESHPESLNSRGSEQTKIMRVHGKRGEVVCAYDDQSFKTDQNAVQITLTRDGTVDVPIADNFVTGRHPNGIFCGERPADGYNYVLLKYIEKSWLDSFVDSVTSLVGEYLNHKDDSDQTTLSGSVGEVVIGVIQKSRNTSDNNRVDNLSSIRFGGEPMLSTSTVAKQLG